jgi:hypothetical protein
MLSPLKSGGDLGRALQDALSLANVPILDPAVWVTLTT